jgi:hypothetical protein
LALVVQLTTMSLSTTIISRLSHSLSEVVVKADDVRRADDIQGLTYALCHVNARATTTVAIPGPLYCDTFRCFHRSRLTILCPRRGDRVLSCTVPLRSATTPRPRQHRGSDVGGVSTGFPADARTHEKPHVLLLNHDGTSGLS